MTDSELDKLQGEDILHPGSQPAGIVISPDTLRANRIPPGQSRTRKWPVLDAGGPPRLDPAKWNLELSGLVVRPAALNLDELGSLPKTLVFSDFHCVTRWSRLGNVWEGVSTRTLVDQAGGLLPEARFAIVRAYDSGWTTNLPVEAFLAEDSLLATHHDGQPLTLDHGGPVRLIVPRLYAWKSAKWIAGVEFVQKDRAGFWERNGYHMNGDPWREERFSGY